MSFTLHHLDDPDDPRRSWLLRYQGRPHAGVTISASDLLRYRAVRAQFLYEQILLPPKSTREWEACLAEAMAKANKRGRA